MPLLWRIISPRVSLLSSCENEVQLFFVRGKSRCLKTARARQGRSRWKIRRGRARTRAERVEKRVCFTSKHSFARIVPSCASPSSDLSSSPRSPPFRCSRSLARGPAHVPASTTCVTRTISRIRRRVASLSFPTPLGKRPPTNRTSPRVKTLNCTERVGVSATDRGLGKKIVQN